MKDINFYKNKKILITGDTGFKGSWLSFILINLGAEVYGYSLPPKSKDDLYLKLNLSNRINHLDGNLLDKERLNLYINQIEPEIVFHLAAQSLVIDSYDDPVNTFETNILGSMNLLESVKNSKSVKSLVYVTSDKCYKNNEWIWGYRENDELGGNDPYSASKAAAEIIFSSYKVSFFDKINHLGVASVRAGNVIGGGDWAKNRIIPDIVRSIKDDLPINIRNPNSTRPWQHVLDPLNGYMLLAQSLYLEPSKFSGSWNFGPTYSSIQNVLYLTNKSIALFNKGSIFINQNENNHHESNALHLNCDKANLKLNWKPVWNFEQTMIQTILWYKNYLNGDEAEILTINDIIKYNNDKKY